MNYSTPSQRLKVYEKMLERFEEMYTIKEHAAGFCWLLKSLAGRNVPIREVVELYKLKPGKNYWATHYWFSLTPRGYAARKRLLIKAIENTKKAIEQNKKVKA